MTRWLPHRSKGTYDDAELEAFAAAVFGGLRDVRPRPATVERVRGLLAARLTTARPPATGYGWGGLRRALAGGAALVPLAAVGTVAAMSGGALGPIDVSSLVSLGGSSGGHGTAALHENGDDREEASPTPDAGSPSPSPIALQGNTPTAPAGRGESGNEAGGSGHGARVCGEATAHARAVLEALLGSGRLGLGGEAGVSHALEAIKACGNEEVTTSGTPDEAPHGRPHGNRPEEVPSPAGPDGSPTHQGSLPFGAPPSRDDEDESREDRAAGGAAAGGRGDVHLPWLPMGRPLDVDAAKGLGAAGEARPVPAGFEVAAKGHGRGSVR